MNTTEIQIEKELDPRERLRVEFFEKVRWVPRNIVTTNKALKLRGGDILTTGCQVGFAHGQHEICAVKSHDGSRFIVRTLNAFEQPSDATIQDWFCDGVWESIAGERVEEDGWDEHGTPSWGLLATCGLVV